MGTIETTGTEVGNHTLFEMEYNVINMLCRTYHMLAILHFFILCLLFYLYILCLQR